MLIFIFGQNSTKCSQVGPMVRSVEDASILMGAISDIELYGCDLNLATCLEDQVNDFRKLENI